MTGFCDPLSIAANVIGAWFDDTGHNPVGWFNFNILRLLSGGGWLVSATQTALILDKYMEKAA